MKEGDRKIYSEMKRRRISTLDLHYMLELVGITISKKTLQNYINNEFLTAKNEKIKVVALKMIEGYDELVEQIKKDIL